MKRLEERPTKQAHKIPNKYFHEEELRAKYSKLKTSSKQDKRAIKRLKNRLEQKEGYVKLDPGFQRDFLTVLKENEHKMTEAEK